MFRALAVLLLTAAPALAQTATADQIRAAVAGNTIEGGMSDGSAYSEFYAEDGSIRAKDYAGTWSLQGDKMCFAYGAPATCYAVSVAGDEVTWLDDAGQPAGSGLIRPGNPNGY
jgi:hypothetical protein